MPTERRRIMLTVLDDTPLRVLGLDPAEAGATQIWAALVRHADAVGRAGRDLERLLSPEGWCLVADVLNGCADLWDLSGTPISTLTLIAAEVEDGHRLDGLGDKWFGEGKGDSGVKALLSTLRGLTPAHGEAVLAAVRFFWSRPDLGVEDKWWKVSARAGEKPRRAARETGAG